MKVMVPDVRPASFKVAVTNIEYCPNASTLLETIAYVLDEVSKVMNEGSNYPFDNRVLSSVRV